MRRNGTRIAAVDALLSLPAWLLAMGCAVMPYRLWRRLPFHVPMNTAAFLSGLAFLFAGAAVGIPGFLEHAHANAGLGIDRALEHMNRTEVYRGDLVIGFSGLSLFTFLLLTPKGWLTMYLIVTGGLRAGAAWFDDPIGDPILTGIDYALVGRREKRQIDRARKARERQEGPVVPDRVVTPTAAGISACDLVIVSSRRKDGWERGVTVLTADAAYRIGEPIERVVAGRLRTLYPLTAHADLEAIRKAVHYELPSAGGKPE
jgi:hypothetical protein